LNASLHEYVTSRFGPYNNVISLLCDFAIGNKYVLPEKNNKKVAALWLVPLING
jgi:hypothetical protein